MPAARRPVLARILADLGDDPTLVGSVREPCSAVPLASALPISTLLQDSVDAAAVLAARAAGSASSAVPPCGSDPRRIAMAVTSERTLRIDGEPPAVWAPLSGFWPAADGWVRTHANYPHHAARLLAALGLPPGASPDELRSELARWDADVAADRITAAGGIAVRVSREDPARDAASAATPLVGSSVIGAARARIRASGDLPLSGVRVLDLTRVIAGPVATRTLALFGADVLRIDSPRLPEIGWQHLDGGAGKRSSLLDLADSAGRRRFDELLATADVVVLGYRPDSLESLGLSPRILAERAPGIVIARLSAWGFSEGDAARRGFDSIVQAASGIAWIESVDGRTPGALPAQALDHSAGYLLAAAIISALSAQAADGGTRVVSTSLRRVAAELLTLPRPSSRPREAAAPEASDHTIDYPVDSQNVTVVRPAPAYAGGPGDFPHGPHRWGSDEPVWLPR